MRALLVTLVVLVAAAPALALAAPPAGAKAAPKGKKGAPPVRAVKPDKPAESKGVTLDKPGRPLGDAAPGAEGGVAPAMPASDDTRLIQRGERMEFDARLIQGQTAKAGAVYLFERVSTNLRSMVRERTSFKEETIRTVFPEAEEARR